MITIDEIVNRFDFGFHLIEHFFSLFEHSVGFVERLLPVFDHLGALLAAAAHVLQLLALLVDLPPQFDRLLAVLGLDRTAAATRKFLLRLLQFHLGPLTNIR